MTTISTSSTFAETAATFNPGRRIWNVVRLQYANVFNMFALPWIILGFVFVVNMVIWISIFAATKEQLTGTQWSGATAYIFIYLAIAAVQAMNLTFRFALGLSATRRDYYIGTALAFVLLGAMFTIVCTLLSYVEDWTGGYGMSAHMFSNVYFGTGPLWERLFSTFAAFLFCYSLGALAGSVFVRWRANGLYTLGGAIVLIAAVWVAAITLTGSWPAVGSWFLAVKAIGVVSWLLIPTAASIVLGFFFLRKAPARD